MATKQSSSKAKAIPSKNNEIEVLSNFVKGYRNREDVTLLDPHVLVVGSHDVLTNTSGRVGSRKGYTVDGITSSVQAPIKAPFDWESGNGTLFNLRAGLLTFTGNDGQLQVRYVASDGTVSWLPLLTGLSSTSFNYTNFWDSINVRALLLMVNGSRGIWEWSGGFTTLASNTSTTVTSSSTLSFSQQGFYSSNTTLGDNTTLYLRTLPVPGTKRYTYSSGLDPAITASTMPVGTQISIPSGSDQGLHTITGINTNYIEFATADTVVTSYTGAITYDGGYSYTVIINGVTYTYTSGAQGTVLRGLTALPTFTAGTPIYNAPVFTNISAFTFTITPTPPSTYTIDLISQLNNQVFIASLTSNLLYMSKVGTYKNYSQSQARVQYEGDQFTTQAPINCLINQEDALYVSAGIGEWYVTNFTQTTITDPITSATTVFENGKLQRLKTTLGQSAISQSLTTKIKNDIVFVSNEPILNSLGRVENILVTPQVTDLSFPIVNEMNEYDFTDGSVFYFQQFIYLAVPKEGLFRVYNMTNPRNPYWEAPQSIALGGFSSNGTTLFGHSYLTSESYILFNGYADRAIEPGSGNPISAVAVFAFQNQGLRAKSKSFNKLFFEGYMTTNTTLNIGITYDFGAFSTIQMFPILGSNPKFTSYGGVSNSFGKFPLGEQPFGGKYPFTDATDIPPWFRGIKTFPRVPYFEYQPSFSSYGVNQRWELLAYGTNSTSTTEGENSITD